MLWLIIVNGMVQEGVSESKKERWGGTYISMTATVEAEGDGDDWRG